MVESDPRLVAFLEGLTPVGMQRETWPSGAVLEVTGYLTERLPPVDLVTSVRAVVCNGNAVLVFEDPWGTHAMPGGRLEPGESPIAALTRELREESGCSSIGEPRLIGFLHLHHLTPRPDRYPYPHPDFLQLVYRVETADEAVEAANEPLVSHPRFVPITELADVSLSAAERGLLDGALRSQ